MTFFIFISYETCNAQEFLNYNEAVLNNKEKVKISAILNSNSIKFSSETTLNKASQNTITLDINYSNLSSLNQVNTVQFQNCAHFCSNFCY